MGTVRLQHLNDLVLDPVKCEGIQQSSASCPQTHPPKKGNATGTTLNVTSRKNCRRCLGLSRTALTVVVVPYMETRQWQYRLNAVDGPPETNTISLTSSTYTYSCSED